MEYEFIALEKDASEAEWLQNLEAVWNAFQKPFLVPKISENRKLGAKSCLVVNFNCFLN